MSDSDEADAQAVNPSKSISSFRSSGAWVLLGEPGAGKSTLLIEEAKATGGQYLRIDEFLVSDLDPAWHGKTLFLDGLDETRGHGASGESVPQHIKTKLKRLGQPAFRIACRAADWYGSTDTEDFRSASPDGQIVKLELEPLTAEDILSILRQRYEIDQPDEFVKEAEKRGIAELLSNPQTLDLLAEAVREGQWPKTRDETYFLACLELATETSKRHRDRDRSRPREPSLLLDAAGQLCSVLLLADKAGLAIDPARADSRFPDISRCSPSDLDTALRVVRSRLFRPSGDERFVPSHRSVAEYLAARWIAHRIDTEGLPLRRVTNILLGSDGGVVAGLRGLFGWLALHSRTARPHLLRSDPVTVVVYGDAKPMPVADKRDILHGLRKEAETFPGFVWHTPIAQPFGSLSDPALQDDIRKVLIAPERKDADQATVNCALKILANGEALPDLAPELLRIVRDDTYWLGVRKEALDVWLGMLNDSKLAVALLEDVSAGRVSDADDELAGALLHHLYPKHISLETLLRHLHIPKHETLLGMYVWFWEYDLPKRALDTHLSTLLDALCARSELFSSDRYAHRLARMADELLIRGLHALGDTVSDERLLDWLGIRVDQHGHIDRDKKTTEAIAAWLQARPTRYKSLLSLCFQRCEKHDHPRYCVQVQSSRFHGAPAPDDIGLWHLHMASSTENDELARLHLIEAADALFWSRGSAGLTLESLEAWAAANPNRSAWLAPLLYWEIPEWRVERAAESKARRVKHSESRRARTIAVIPHLASVRDGTARADLLHQLAGVWMNLYVDIRGETVSERFNNYTENGAEVMAAAEAGFRRCPLRANLPTAEEIVELNLKQREHFVRRPCLIGMDLLWEDGPAARESLTDDILRRMVAFRLTFGIGEQPNWFRDLVQRRPALVADVLVMYAIAALKAGQDNIDSIYPLPRDPLYRDVASIAAPRLLGLFPVRAKVGQLRQLESLLKAALKHVPEVLSNIVSRKISLRGMDVAQKVHWLAAAMLLDPATYEDKLWRYVGKSASRANQLISFLADRDDRLTANYDLSAKAIGKLIELVAPHSVTDWPAGGGLVTEAMRRGEHVRGLITQLGSMATAEAASEINRLLSRRELAKLRIALENARHQQKLHQRESEFNFLEAESVAQVLANKAPASSEDLLALTLDHLDDIGAELRHDNDDGFRAFWNVENRMPVNQREENLCRDVLLTRLRARLHPLGIDCEPEGDYANDRRADIRISYHSEYEVPIEIKRDSNPAVWTGLRNQLMKHYVPAPRAGFGIYVVLWFGGVRQALPADGGKKPASAQELQDRLEAPLSPSESRRIAVRVLDVSWPNEV